MLASVARRVRLAAGGLHRWEAAAGKLPCTRCAHHLAGTSSSSSSPWLAGAVLDPRQTNAWLPSPSSGVPFLVEPGRHRAATADPARWFIMPDAPRDSGVAEKPALHLDSVKKKRRKMMNKHKLQKRRKRDRMKRRTIHAK